MSSRFEFPGSAQAAERFSRRVSGRAYPSAARRLVAEATELPDDDLSFVIERSIRARWNIKERLDEYTEYRELIADYLHDINLLRDAVHEMRQVVVAAWRLNTEFFSQTELNAGAREQFMRKHADKLAVMVDRHLIPPPAQLSAKLEAMPLERAFSELRDGLEQALARFAREVCVLLDTLVDQGMVGIVQWAVPTACDIYYFRTLVIQQEQESQIVRGQEKVIGIRQFFFGHVEKLRREVFKISRGEHIVRRGKYELYLTDASSSRFEDRSVLIPHDIAAYCDQLPTWLKDIARVVHGTELKRRLVAMDVDLERWEDTQVEVFVRERICGCPVITLGHYVLTGWGDEEEGQETARRWSKGLFALAVVLQLLAIGLFSLGQLLHPGFGVASAFASALGLLSFVESRRQRALWDNKSPRIKDLGLAGLFWVVFSIGAMCVGAGIFASQGVLLAIGIGVSLLGGIAAGLRFKSR